MEFILENWKLLLPIFIIQLAFQIFALVDLFKKFPLEIRGSKVLWAIIILIFGILGPIIYFIFGRK